MPTEVAILHISNFNFTIKRLSVLGHDFTAY